MSAQSPHPDPIGACLAGRDVACSRCGYNLRGLQGTTVCPECAAELPAWLWSSADFMSDQQRTALYLTSHDCVCRSCRTNLRGHESGVCPGCGRVYVVKSLPGEDTAEPPPPRWHTAAAAAIAASLAAGFLAVGAVLAGW